MSMCHSLIEHGIVAKTPKYEEWERDEASEKNEDSEEENARD